MTTKITKVLFIFQPREELQQYLIEGLKDVPNLELIFPENTEEETFLSYAPEIDIIVGWQPTEKLLEEAKKLSLFINPGAGVYHLTELIKELNHRRKVTLCNGHGNTYFTAQHAVALLLALTNKIIPHHNWMINGLWRKGDTDAQSIPLRGRNIGLLGYGAINTKVHRFLSGFDVEFHILKRDWTRKRSENYPTPFTQYSIDDLESFLTNIDTLILAIPLTSQTKNLLGKHELQLLGPTGLLVTVARGEIIDEEHLFTALKEKAIAGAAIDVWYNYRPEPDAQGRKYPYNYPFHELDNVILSPHRGASPMNDLLRWNEVIENIKRFSQGEKEFLNVVDLELEY